MLLNCGAWRRLLRVNLDRKEINPVSPKGNQSWILEGLILKLKLQYFGHRMRRADSLEKPLMLGKIEGNRRGQQKMRWLDSITGSMDMILSELQEMRKPGVLQSMGWQGVRHKQQQQNSTRYVGLSKPHNEPGCAILCDFNRGRRRVESQVGHGLWMSRILYRWFDAFVCFLPGILDSNMHKTGSPVSRQRE